MSTPQTQSFRNRIILAKSSGRLGNQLFFFANVIAFSLEEGFTISNPSFHSYAHWFEGSSQQAVPAYPLQTPSSLSPKQRLKRLSMFRTLQAMLPGTLHIKVGSGSLIETLLLKLGIRRTSSKKLKSDRTFFYESDSSKNLVSKMKARRNTYVSGYMFVAGDRLMKKYQPQIKEYFSTTPEITKQVTSRIQAVRKKDYVLIGVHLRKGDYRVYREGKYFFEDEEYASFLTRLRTVFPDQNLQFLLFSDEKIRLEVFDGLDVSVSDGSPIEDLYQMAHCDYLAGPPSTFTKWASYVGEVPLCVIESATQPAQSSDFRLYYNH